MLLADTGEACAVVADSLFLAINKKDCSKKKKKVLLGCICFSKGCAAGGKQMVSKQVNGDV